MTKKNRRWWWCPKASAVTCKSIQSTQNTNQKNHPLRCRKYASYFLCVQMTLMNETTSMSTSLWAENFQNSEKKLQSNWNTNKIQSDWHFFFTICYSPQFNKPFFIQLIRFFLFFSSKKTMLNKKLCIYAQYMVTK